MLTTVSKIIEKWEYIGIGYFPTVCVKMEIRMSVTRCQSELADFLQSKDWILYALIQGQIYLQVTKKAKEEKLKDFWFEKSNIGISFLLWCISCSDINVTAWRKLWPKTDQRLPLLIFFYSTKGREAL